MFLRPTSGKKAQPKQAQDHHGPGRGKGSRRDRGQREGADAESAGLVGLLRIGISRRILSRAKKPKILISCPPAVSKEMPFPSGNDVPLALGNKSLSLPSNIVSPMIALPPTVPVIAVTMSPWDDVVAVIVPLPGKGMPPMDAEGAVSVQSKVTVAAPTAWAWRAPPRILHEPSRRNTRLTANPRPEPSQSRAP